jgi:hypothetical protein
MGNQVNKKWAFEEKLILFILKTIYIDFGMLADDLISHVIRLDTRLCSGSPIG